VPRRAVGLREGALVGLAVAVVALAGLALTEALDVGVLLDPRDAMVGGGGAAALGVGLLIADVVVPVPSSLVMLAHGALFGTVPGALLSLVGRTGNAVVGVMLGRGAASLLTRRAAPVTPGEGLVRRWGLAAVAMTRPVPVLAESTLAAAGAIGLSAPAVVAAATVGALPEAVLYAHAGAAAATFGNAAIVFAAALVPAAVAWALGTRFTNRRASIG
jgi:uncharacterized membrane protein YdjX (TVP38/TMEM64 family)